MNQRKANLLKKKMEEGKYNVLPDLPEHVIAEILVKIPPECLNEKFRYICKSWNRLISSPEFIRRIKIHRNPEFLIQAGMRYKTSLLIVDEERLHFQLRNIDYPHMGQIRSSCNGLILVDNNSPLLGVFSVRNIVNGSVINLPRCPSGCYHGTCGVALGYVPCSKQYKVVHMYADGFGFEIFAFFIDNKTFSFMSPDNTWKRIPGPFNAPCERPFNIEQFTWSDPVLIGGQVMHWFVDSDKYIISMDISDEKVSKTNLPNWGKQINRLKYDLVEIDGKLSFMYRYNSCIIDIWILKDFAKQVWSKEHSINASATKFTGLSTDSLIHRKKSNTLPDTEEVQREDTLTGSEEKNDKLPAFQKLVLVASLRNGEVLVFKHQTKSGVDDRVYVYDMKLQELKKLQKKIKSEPRFIPYRSSCISWKN
ncbi:hypothetical protein SLE2022_074510 [Rubroshorea leprosula]